MQPKLMVIREQTVTQGNVLLHHPSLLALGLFSFSALVLEWADRDCKEREGEQWTWLHRMHHCQGTPLTTAPPEPFCFLLMHLAQPCCLKAMTNNNDQRHNTGNASLKAFGARQSYQFTYHAGQRHAVRLASAIHALGAIHAHAHTHAVSLRLVARSIASVSVLAGQGGGRAALRSILRVASLMLRLVVLMLLMVNRRGRAVVSERHCVKGRHVELLGRHE